MGQPIISRLQASAITLFLALEAMQTIHLHAKGFHFAKVYHN